MTSRINTDRVAVLDEYVEDAAWQRLHLLGWQRDRRFVESGGQIIYSIDTDILKLFLNPVRMAVPHPKSGRGPGPGYTQIFRHDPPELSIALGRTVAEFIFFRLGKRSSILMLPPLEREVGEMFQAVALDADREHRDAFDELDRLRVDVTAFVKRIQLISNREERLNLMINEMPRLHGFLFGYSGPSVELKRFAVLLEHSPLTDLDNFMSKPRRIDAGTVEHLRRELNSVRSWIEFSYLQGGWEDRVKPLKSRRMAAKNIEADCRALARVEQLNRILKSFNVRVVHVTGDRAIFKAAVGYRLDLDDSSFAECYLRSPRSFLAEPSVLFTEDSSDLRRAEEVIPWLDIFLANIIEGEEVSSVELLGFLEQTPQQRHGTVQRVLEHDPDAGIIFQNRWDDFCGPITLNHIRSTVEESSSHIEQYLSILSGWADGSAPKDSQSFRKAARELREETNSFERILDDLEGLVVERVLTTWRDCFAAATSTGFSLLRFGADGEPPARSSLPITFAKFQAASNFFSGMLRDGSSGRYREMIDALHDEDDTGYLFYLAFGALFGAQGKWRVARILADRALAIVETGSHEQHSGKINGREAYYLRAAAQRLTARHHDDFDKAENDLRKARDALKQSRADNLNHPITDLRFDAEQVAVDLSRLLFDLFEEKVDERDPWLESLGRLQMNIIELLGRVDRELREENAGERVRRALLVNYLMCVIARAMPPFGTFNSLEVRMSDRSIFNDLRERMTGQIGARIEQSYLHRAVLLAAGALLDPPETAAAFRSRRAELLDHFQESGITENLITTYDRRRFEFMRDFAMNFLGVRYRRGGRPTEF